MSVASPANWAVVSRARPGNAEEQRRVERSHLSRRKGERTTVANMFKHKSVRYAAA